MPSGYQRDAGSGLNKMACSTSTWQQRSSAQRITHILFLGADTDKFFFRQSLMKTVDRQSGFPDRIYSTYYTYH